MRNYGRSARDFFEVLTDAADDEYGIAIDPRQFAALDVASAEPA